MSTLDDLRSHLTAIRTLVKGVTGGLSALAVGEDPFPPPEVELVPR